jgi:hypothetical protein
MIGLLEGFQHEVASKGWLTCPLSGPPLPLLLGPSPPPPPPLPLPPLPPPPLPLRESRTVESTTEAAKPPSCGATAASLPCTLHARALRRQDYATASVQHGLALVSSGKSMAACLEKREKSIWSRVRRLGSACTACKPALSRCVSSKVLCA